MLVVKDRTVRASELYISLRAGCTTVTSALETLLVVDLVVTN